MQHSNAIQLLRFYNLPPRAWALRCEAHGAENDYDTDLGSLPSSCILWAIGP